MKSISTFVALMISISIVIGIAVILYPWYSGFIQKVTSEQESLSELQIKCKYASIKIFPETLKFWKYKRKIVLNNSLNPYDLTNYVTFIRINVSELSGKTNNCNDIRFFDFNYGFLDYEIVNCSLGYFWVKIPYLKASDVKTIYLLYGNSKVTNESKSIKDNSLVLFLTFDEGYGTIAYDYSGYKNNGTLYNASQVCGNPPTTSGPDYCPTWIDGKIRKALSFDGIDDYVKVPTSPSIRDYSKGVTVCLWFKANRIDISQGQFGQNGPGYLNFWMPAGTSYTCLRWETDGGQNFCSNTPIYSNVWYFACGMYDTSLSSNQAKLYINGNLDKQASLTFTTTKTADITIGGYGVNQYLFNGTIDEVRVYNRALSESEIKTLYYFNYSIGDEEPGIIFLSVENNGQIKLYDLKAQIITKTSFTENVYEMYSMQTFTKNYPINPQTTKNVLVNLTQFVTFIDTFKIVTQCPEAYAVAKNVD